MNLKLKIPIANRGYAQSIREIGEILSNNIMSKEITEIFDGYVEDGVTEEAAAILTLAEVIKAATATANAALHTIDVMTKANP
jgi:hypothetical protein